MGFCEICYKNMSMTENHEITVTETGKIEAYAVDEKGSDNRNKFIYWNIL